MKIPRVRTEAWHNDQEGEHVKPLKVGSFYKKGFWKRYDRRKYIRNLLKQIEDEKISDSQ